jgi:hypothetical protein
VTGLASKFKLDINRTTMKKYIDYDKAEDFLLPFFVVHFLAIKKSIFVDIHFK